MCPTSNPYDELPYESVPVDWSAPERLALASLLHGGPRPPLVDYRVLELGCGNGANLLPLAYYRRGGRFVGIDGAQSQIELACRRKQALELSNIEFLQAEFRSAIQCLSGKFDYIIAHGVFSWIEDRDRDALMELCIGCLDDGGLLYLNYNARPGWNVRGLVREFLLAQTSRKGGLRSRARHAQEVAAKIVAAMDGLEHNYSKLLANEFRFVCKGDMTWVAHEYLAETNRPYWRSEFLTIVRRHGLEYVADADFNYPTGRISEDLMPRLEFEEITGRSIDDTMDLLCYRQIHSPILTLAPFERHLPGPAEFGDLLVASCLEACAPGEDTGNSIFKHPSGYEVEVKQEFISNALRELRPLWPRGLRIAGLFPDVDEVIDDLKLLQRNRLLELRCIEPGGPGLDGETLNRMELEWGGYLTTPYHDTWQR